MLRKALLLCLVFILSISMFAQVPDAFKYQAVIKNSSGEILQNQDVSIQISILDGSATGTNVFTETHSVTTSNSGLINLNIGKGTFESGDFSSINWASGDKYLKVEIDETGGTTYTDLGAVELLSVPYALYANDVANKDDADADSTNEIQDLDLTGNILTITNHPSPTEIDLAPFQGTNTDEQELTLAGDTLKISNGNEVVLPYDSSNWVIQGNTMYYNGGNVGIGTSTPVSNLEVKDNIAGSDALFQVINANNDTVFAVYSDGVKIFIDPEAKGRVGGFAISGRSPSKAGEVEYMRVTTDSTRIYVNEPIDGKGSVGGFAISGRSPSKGIVNDYLVVTGDSTRIYVNDSLTVKGRVGGFAISGRSPSKGTINDYLQVTRDSTRVYVTESTTKGRVGGFAISGRSPSKGVARKFMDMTKDNYFIGHESGQKTTDGLYNSFMGYESGFSNTLGSNNSFIGYRTGYNNTDGNKNTFLGDSSGFGNTEGSGNLFVGKNSGISNSTGSYNSFIGYKSGYSNTNGLNNSFLGSLTGYSNTSGSYNTFAGDSAGYGSTTGDNNSFFGNKAGYNNFYGENNVFIGNECGYSNKGSSNVYIGNFTGFSNIHGGYNIFIGDYAGYYSTSSSNTFIGNYAGYSSTTGGNNVFIGDYVGLFNTSGNFNVFQGCNAGQYNTEGNYNVFQGYLAGHYNDLGSWNVFIGDMAGYSNSTSEFNVAIGKSALYTQNYDNGDTWESANTAVGAYALYLNKSTSVNNGINNTAVGYSSLRSNTTGNLNTAIGYSAFSSGTSYTNSTALGYDAEPGASNTIAIGNTSVTWIGGQVTWSTYSDLRMKNNVKEDVKGLGFIMNLRPVTYYFDKNKTDELTGKVDSSNYAEKYDIEKIRQSGFLAQEVEQAAIRAGYDFSGISKPKGDVKYYSLSYAEFVVPLVKGMQEQQQIINNQKSEISELKARLTEIEKLLMAK